MNMPAAEPTGLSPLNLIRTGPRGAPPVVLIHPVGLDLTYWADQIEALCDRFDVLALDLPGHGRSPAAPADWTLTKGAAQVAQVVAGQLGCAAHIVGLSLGGMIAQQMAISQPQAVASLNLVDTSSRYSDEVRTVMRSRAETVRTGGMGTVVDSTLDRWFTAQTRARRPDLMERVTRTLLADDAASHAVMWGVIAALDLIADLRHIHCPTQVLVGELDPSTPPATARQLQQGIAGARLEVIPSASHMAPLERPGEVNRLLVGFLDGIARGGGSRA